MSEDNEIKRMTTDIVCAYVSNNQVLIDDLPKLIKETQRALVGGSLENDPLAACKILVPAVSIKKSITDDYLICLEDGKKFKSLKRHLRTSYGMSPDEYRQKWGLAHDYPMVAPNYSKNRSALASEMGLGTFRKSPRK